MKREFSNVTFTIVFHLRIDPGVEDDLVDLEVIFSLELFFLVWEKKEKISITRHP